MRWLCWFMLMVVAAVPELVRADEGPRRMRRVESGPARPAPVEQPQAA
ncbi:MAG: hypothetical protein IH621_12135, partial [Krumholzibacteria bacterium]|nr:hypothetical protein [Candidatus Krumholzibacteria bacterium]